MKKAKSLTTCLGALALLGLAQSTALAQQADLLELELPEPPLEALSWPESISGNCRTAWLFSQAVQYCDTTSITELVDNTEHPVQCEINVRCRSTKDFAPWDSLSPWDTPSGTNAPVEREWQGSIDEVPSLHYCDGYLGLQAC